MTDLLREGFNDEAATLEVLMKTRVEHWDSVDAPFGSEMAWDPTAQEGVYQWASFAPLSNINEAGCPSASFHSFPDTLQWDGFTADYGPGFLGMALSSGTYVAEDEQVGLVAYGGKISIDGSNVMVEPRDPVRKTVFIGPLAVLITVDLIDAPKAMNATVWTDSAQVSWEYSGNNVKVARGGWKIPMDQERVNITLSLKSA
ncbi:hypothetical protein Landi51_13554 [Colletotrichum acutatum]